jgi:hypothetical protein
MDSFICSERSTPGVYDGNIQLKSTELNMEIPYKVRVLNYVLPRIQPLRRLMAFLLTTPARSLTDEQKKEVFDLYMKTCMEYRISPYTPHAFAPIKWKFEGHRHRQLLILQSSILQWRNI